MAKWSVAELRDIFNGTYTGNKPVTSYAKRIANGLARGASRSRAGGKFTKVEKATRPSTFKHKAPPIRPGDRIKQMGSTTRVKRANSKTAANDLRKSGGLYQRGKNKPIVQTRVWINVFNPHTGQFVSVYKGGRNKPHGITIRELNDRIQERIDSGEAENYDEGLRLTLIDDSAGSGGADSPDGENVEEDFTQVEIHYM